MRTTHVAWMAAAAMAAALTAAPALAQGRGGGPRYDRLTERTVTGVVEDVQSHQGRVGEIGRAHV